MAETQGVQLQCPNCGTQYQANVRTVIDVGQEPRLCEALLSGALNQTVCPNCGTGGILEVPLVYHDPQNEFLAVYFPTQLQIPELERQRMIGELTQGLMRNLPAEQRKGYFFSPRQFVNRQNLLDAVLGTMGVSQEELDRQRKKMALLEKLTVMADDPKGLEMMIKGQDAMLDHEFYLILASRLSQAQAMGDQKTAERLATLRTNLMPVTTYGRRLAKQQAAVDSLADVKTPDELLDKVTAADLDEATAMAVAARPLLDYAFFQKLTERAEAADGAEKERLLALRNHLSEVTKTLDDATRAQMKEASDLLREILQSPNPRSALRERADLIDDVFLAVLSMNLQEAERQGAQEAVAMLSALLDEINAMAAAGLPPEMQLINDLLQAEYPEETRELLHEYSAEITPEFLALLDELAKSLTAGEGQAEEERQEALETAKRLRDIRGQAMLLAEIKMNAEIITSGTELLLGETVDTNSTYIARALRDVGVNLYFKTTVGDNVDRMAMVLRLALDRSDVVIVTGGLGPTVDDVTREAVAQTTGRTLEVYPECMAHIEALFARWGRQVSENNRRQAYLPAGSIAIENPVGTAPGFILETDDGTIIALPGVPREMERLMQDTVLPYLRARTDGEPVVIKARVLRTVGQGESWIDERLDAQMRSANPTVGLAAHLGSVDVRITARGPSHEVVDAMIAEMEAQVRARIGDDIIFGTDAQTLEAVTAALLAQAGVKLAIIESATGGQIARMLREAPQGREVITAAHVARDAAELAEKLGLSLPKLEAFGWVSPMAVAEAGLELVDTYDGGWGLAVLSEAEPGNDVYGDRPGCTYMALAAPDATVIREYNFGGQGELAQRWVTLRALDLLRRQALQKLAQQKERKANV